MHNLEISITMGDHSPMVLTGKKKMVTIAVSRTELPTASRVSRAKTNTIAINRASEALIVFLNWANAGSDDLNRAIKLGFVGGVAAAAAAGASVGLAGVLGIARDEDDSVAM